MPIAYLMVGCAGSGKSLSAKALMSAGKGTLICKDEIRSQLAEKMKGSIAGFIFDEGLKEIADKAYHAALRKHTRDGKDVIIDATNLTPEWRARSMSYFRSKEPYTIIAIAFTPNQNRLLNNIGQRNFRWALNLLNDGDEQISTISFEFVRQQIKQFVPPTMEEGFSKIITKKVMPGIQANFTRIPNIEQAEILGGMISHGPADFETIRTRIEEAHARAEERARIRSEKTPQAKPENGHSTRVARETVIEAMQSISEKREGTNQNGARRQRIEPKSHMEHAARGRGQSLRCL